MHYLTIGVATAYTLRSALFIIGAFKARKIAKQAVHRAQSAVRPSVSIIIPARNEQKSIGRCIESVLASTYSEFELILINDRSGDDTGQIIDEFARRDGRIKAVHIKNDAEKGNLRGKPGALHMGIGYSSGQIIMMTDADCIVQPEWIQTTISIFASNSIALLPSFTVLKCSRFFEHMQDMEWVFNHTLASIGIAIGHPLGCFGNNLSIRRDVYDSLGGYQGIPFSVTEDLALLQAVHKKNLNILYPCLPELSVITLPCTSWNEFITQQHRWLKGGMALGWKAAFFVSYSALLWAAFINAIIVNDFSGAAILLLLRLIGDILIIAPTIHMLKRKRQYKYVLPGIFFILFMELIAPILLLRKTVRWKGQQF
jgi:cellulose synthase/poly-beta-1,6-N-acetylglucosamine synthase-like glycosyltransferase